jgi:hypothetical protein
MTDECVILAPFGPDTKQYEQREMDGRMVIYFAINFLNVIFNSKFMTLSIRRDSSTGIPTHGNLVWLYDSYLSILIENTKRVTVCLEDDTDSLKTTKGLDSILRIRITVTRTLTGQDRGAHNCPQR